eukprot:COSAG02_NODE_7901_length_2798_cov_4.107447_5_plen_150_part_00
MCFELPRTPTCCRCWSGLVSSSSRWSPLHYVRSINSACALPSCTALIKAYGFRLCGARLPISCESRRIDDCDVIALCLHGVCSKAHGTAQGQTTKQNLHEFGAHRIFAGNVSSRLYKSFNGLAWKRNTLMVRSHLLHSYAHLLAAPRQL